MKKLPRPLGMLALIAGFLAPSLYSFAQSQFQRNNRNPGSVEVKQKATSNPKAENSESKRQKVLKKFPEEASKHAAPSLDEVVSQMQSGKKFNLKKVIKKNGGANLFTSKEDNPRLREEYNNQRLRDPNTGLIPENIRKDELKYVLSVPSKMQQNALKIKSTAATEFATPGSQLTAWTNRGPYNVGGRTRALALDIDDENIILAGGVSGGMWRSTNQGTTWTRVTTAEQHPTVTDVMQDPRAGFHDTWYYSTGERLGASQSARNGAAFLQGNGIYKSTDNGVTWSVLAATENSAPQSFDNPFDLTFGLAVHPTTGHLYVATFDGIQRSTDGGVSFAEVLPADFDNFADIHITSTGIIYVTLDDGAGTVGTDSGIFRSTDGGSGTWVNITDASFPSSFGRTEIYSAPSNPNILYVISDGTGSAPVDHDFWKYTYVSGDGSGAGGTWENRTANLPDIGGNVGDFNSQGGYDLYVRVHPTDPDFVLIGGTNIYRSTDGFATSNNSDWVAGYSPLNNISLYTNHHPDQHSLLFLPSNPNVVISGHDGGVSITTDITADGGGTEPVTWTSLNNGYLTTQVYALSIGPENQIMAGFQDNSTWFTSSTDGTADWTDLWSGDGSYNAFNDAGNVRYMSSQNGNVWKNTYSDPNSTNPTNFQSITPTGSSGFLFVNPFELDPNTDEIMYFAAGSTLWRNDNLSNATNTIGWTEMTNATAAGGTISTIGISTSPANVVYFGTTSGAVHRIDNVHSGNPSATDVFTGTILPSGNVASIAVDPNDSNNVYAVFSNYSIPSVFFSNNGGASWTDISGNLEENTDGSGAGPSVRWIDIVGSSDLFLVGTSTGMYSTSTINGSSTVWTQVDASGIGNVVVEQIRSREDGLVVAGTHGNGLYSATFEVSVANVTVANSVDNVVVDVNSQDTEIDISDVFVSNAVPPLAITVSVEDNSNTGLVTTSVSGNTLTLSYLTDQFGEATIMLRGEDENMDFITSSFNVTVTPPPASNFPFTVNFDDGLFPADWERSGSMSWSVNSQGTPSGGTGPVVDNTLGNDVGVYLYAEVTGFEEGDEAIFTTQSFDISSLSNPIIEFYYHMFGADMGTLNVAVIDVTNSTETTIFTISGQQQSTQSDPYTLGFASLFPFSNSEIRLKFTSIRGPGFTSDIAIDDISILNGPDNDLAAVGVSSALYTVIGAPNQVTIEIENRGGQAESSINVGYRLPDNTEIFEVIDATIEPGTTTFYTFNSTYSISELGAFNIDAFVQLVGDENTDNDQIQFTGAVLGEVNTFPYEESFEAGDGDWFALEVNNSFQLGAPVNNIISAASDGTQAWVTNLTGNYNSSENSTVVSPVFDLSNIIDPLILLDINFATEFEWDGAVLQYSVDMGESWQNVGLLNDLTNWYNGTNLGSLSFAGTSIDSWTGSSGGYLLAAHNLDQLAGSDAAILRIAFGSDSNTEDEGFAFDNVRILSGENLLSIVCDGNIEVPNDTGSCEAAVTIAQPTITGETGNITLVNSYNNTDNASDTYPTGSTEVVWTVSDDLGIVKSCTVEIVVLDDELPVFSPMNDISVAVGGGVEEVLVTYDPPTVTDNCPLEITITQSQDQTLVAGNSLICPPGPNSYLRVFDISEFGVDIDLVVESLDFGIEEAIGTSGTQMATANIYIYDPVDPFEYGSFELLASEEVTIPDGNLFLQNVPMNDAIIPAGATVAVELASPYGSEGPTLFMAGQPNGAQGISYVASVGCGLIDPLDVDVAAGSDSSADWIFNINGGSAITQTDGLGSGSLFPIGTTTEVFEAIDFSGNLSTISFDVNVAPHVTSTFPYIVNFDDGEFPMYWGTSGSMSWTVNSSGTPSGGTGPTVDNTIGDDSGSYLYSEATGLLDGDEAVFTTQIFDISTLSNPILEFYYHMFGADIGTLNVDVIDLTNNSETTIFSTSGQQQSTQEDPYLMGFASLSSFSNSEIRLKFTSVRGPGFTSDIALDDIAIFNGPDNDLAITGISTPFYTVKDSENQITIEIENRGGQPQSSIEVGYRLPNGSDVIEIIDTTVQPGTSASYTFNSTYIFPETGEFSLEAFVQLTNDENTDNNEQQFNGVVLGQVSLFPYTESFETSNGDWFALGGNNSFELGAPENVVISSAPDGTQAWATNLSGNYNSSESSIIVGPVFDLTNVSDPYILLDIQYVTEADFDGAVLQYSTDLGVNWQNVGFLNDETNWYNGESFRSLSFASNSKDSWTGNSDGYLLAGHSLDQADGSSSVIIRIAFGSDSGLEDEGFAFDNVRILSGDGFLNMVCSGNIEVANDAGSCEATVTIQQPTVTGATGIVTLLNSYNNSDNASDTYPLGITEVVWTATDDLEVVKTCTIQVIVSDIEAPEFNSLQDIFIEVASGTTESLAEYEFPMATDNCILENTITQSPDQTLVAGNSLICGTGPNSYLRVFDLPSYGINIDFNVGNLSFGIQSAQSTSGSQMATANIYSYDPNDVLSFSALNLLASEEVTIPNGDLFLLDVPMNDAIIPNGSTVVVELFSPNGNGDPSLSIAGQPNEAQGISYLATPFCSNPEPTNVDLVGNGDTSADWIININRGDAIKQTSGLGSGSLFPIGTTIEAFEVTDLSGNVSTVSLSVIVSTGSLNTPVALPASDVGYFSFSAHWNSSSDATQYLLDVSDDNFATFVLGFNGKVLTGTSEIIDGLTPGTSYQYRVRTSDGLTAFSANSNVIDVTTGDGFTLMPMEGITGSSFTVSWSEVAGADSYQVEVALDEEFTNVVEEVADISTLSTEVTGLTENTTYYTRARAADGNAFTSYTNVESGTTEINAPSDLVAIEETNGIALTWLDNSDVEDGFVIERSVDGTNFSEIGTVASNVTSYTDETTIAGSSYTYQVAAESAGVVSEYTATSIESITGIDSEFLSNSVNIIPNPSQGIFKIEIDNERLENVSVTVWSIVGGLVLKKSAARDSHNFEFNIDLTKQSGSIYFMRIETEDGVGTVKKLLKD